MADVQDSPDQAKSAQENPLAATNNSKNNNNNHGKDSPPVVLNGQSQGSSSLKIKGAGVWKDPGSVPTSTATQELNYNNNNNNNSFVTLVSGVDPNAEVINFDTTSFDATSTVWLDKSIPGFVLHPDQVFPVNGNFPQPTQSTLLGGELKGHYHQNQCKVSPTRRRYTNSRGSSPSSQSGTPCPAANLLAAAAAAGPPTSNLAGQHVVHLHVNPGETISFQIGDQIQLIQVQQEAAPLATRLRPSKSFEGGPPALPLSPLDDALIGRVIRGLGAGL